MKQVLLIASLLVMPGVAGAQDAFAPIFSEAPARIFPLTDFDRQLNAAARMDGAPAIPNVLLPEVMLLGEDVVLTIEDEGVRLPDAQFSLD
jgi:hypothetical protein